MRSNHPPKFARKLLALFCNDYWLDELLGDLEEEYNDNIKSRGRTRANLICYWQVLLLIRPHILKKTIKLITQQS